MLMIPAVTEQTRCLLRANESIAMHADGHVGGFCFSAHATCAYHRSTRESENLLYVCVWACGRVFLCMQGNLQQVQDRLSCLTIQPRYPRKDGQCPQCEIQTDNSVTLLAQLQALESMNWSDATDLQDVQVSFRVPMTHAIMEILTDIPMWVYRVDFTQCTWPLPHTQYKALASHVPLTCTDWQLNIEPDQAYVKTPPSMWWLHVCAGINERRKGLDLPALKVHLHGFAPSEGGSQEVPVGDHVVLVPVEPDVPDVIHIVA